MGDGGFGRVTSLDILDDACLLRIFSYLDPLPDLFAVCATCRRFRDVARNQSTWLVTGSVPGVGRALDERAHGDHGAPRGYHATLAAAVAASRPGDTVVIEGGAQEHAIPAGGIAIRHALRIHGRASGGGSAGAANAGGVHVVGVPGAAPVLSFQAPAHVIGLSVTSCMGPCIAHHAGTLVVEGCILQAETRGLRHLVSPIATFAVSGVAPGGAATAGDARKPRGTPLHAATQHSTPAPGVLKVSETMLLGDCSVPVQQAGSGRIAHARAIVQDHGTLLWFDVDSGVPGSTPGSDASACEARDPPAHACGARYPPAHACGARHPPAPASSAIRGGQTQPEHCAPRSIQPSWVGRATFDPVAFQEHAAALSRKANDWRIWHAQDLRGRRTAEEPHRRAQAEKHGAKRAFDSAFAAASRAE